MVGTSKYDNWKSTVCNLGAADRPIGSVVVAAGHELHLLATGRTLGCIAGVSQALQDDRNLAI